MVYDISFYTAENFFRLNLNRKDFWPKIRARYLRGIFQIQYLAFPVSKLLLNFYSRNSGCLILFEVNSRVWKTLHFWALIFVHLWPRSVSNLPLDPVKTGNPIFGLKRQPEINPKNIANYSTQNTEKDEILSKITLIAFFSV